MLAFAGPLRSCLCLERVTVSTFRWTRVPLKTPVLQEAKRHHCWYTSEVARFKEGGRAARVAEATLWNADTRPELAEELTRGPRNVAAALRGVGD